MAEITQKPEPRTSFKIIPEDVKFGFNPNKEKIDEARRLAEERKERVKAAGRSSSPDTRPVRDILDETKGPISIIPDSSFVRTKLK